MVLKLRADMPLQCTRGRRAHAVRCMLQSAHAVPVSTTPLLCSMPKCKVRTSNNSCDGAGLMQGPCSGQQKMSAALDVTGTGCVAFLGQCSVPLTVTLPIGCSGR